MKRSVPPNGFEHAQGGSGSTQTEDRLLQVLQGHCSECNTTEAVELIDTTTIVIVRKPKRSELGATLSPLACGLGRVGQLTPELGHRQIEISLCNHGVQQLVPTPHQQFEA